MKSAEITITISILELIVLCHVHLVTGRVKKDMKFGCENKSLTLDCHFPDQVICLIQAMPKPRSKYVCQSAPDIKIKTSCSQDDVLRIFDPKCHGKRLNCTLLVKSEAMGDHCQGAFKYISVIYKCVKATGNSTKAACTRNAKTTSPPLSSPSPSTPLLSSSLPPEKDSIITKVVPSLSSSSTSTPLLAFVKTCARPVSSINPPKAEVSKIAPFSFTSPRPNPPPGKRRSGCCKVSMDWLVKVLFSCIFCTAILSQHDIS